MRRLYFAVLVSTTLLCCSAIADVPIRLITWNSEEGIADTAPRREASGNQLTTLDLDGAGPAMGLSPDLLCIQEDRSQTDLAAFRADYLPGYGVRRGSSQFEDAGGNTQSCIFRSDLTLELFTEFNHGGPRRHHRMVFSVAGSDEQLVIYNAHFKAGGTSSDIATRTVEANGLANRVATDRVNGIDVDGDGTRELFPVYYAVCGDLNQSDFSGTAIDALLLGGDNGLDPQLNDMRVESILGALIGSWVGGTQSTRFGLTSRLDYILVSDAIFDQVDANNDDVWSQGEFNAAGFVYFSGDDNGLLASGDLDATSVAADHAPVVVNFVLPASPAVGDVDGDGDVDPQDLALLLSSFDLMVGQPGFNPNADFDDNGSVDSQDLALMLSHWTS